jgi:hypothetical protein
VYISGICSSLKINMSDGMADICWKVYFFAKNLQGIYSFTSQSKENILCFVLFIDREVNMDFYT